MTVKAYSLAAVVSVASSTATAGSMEIWIEDVLPQSYPKLVQMLETDGPMTVRWSAQSGDVIKVEARLINEVLVISTTVPTASIIKDDWVDVEIADADLDGHPDRALYDIPGDPKLIRTPLDDASEFVWYSALAMIFRQTGCCG